MKRFTKIHQQSLPRASGFLLGMLMIRNPHVYQTPSNYLAFSYLHMTPFPTDPYEQFNTFTYRDRYMGYNDFFLKKKVGYLYRPA